MVAQPSHDFERALSHAYRRACRSGLADVGTDLVLTFTAVFVNRRLGLHQQWRSRDWREAHAGRGTLADPQPPAASPPESEDAALEADAVLRAAAYSGSDIVRLRYRNKRPDLPAFSPAVRVAVYEAIREASWWGVEHARPEHLLVGLLSVPDSAASRLLSGWAGGHQWFVTTTRSDPVYGYDGQPHQWAIDSLAFTRVLPHREPWFWRWPWRAFVWVSRMLAARRFRRHGAWYGHPILSIVENRATDTAVRAGRARVTGADVLVTLIDFHEQLTAAGLTLPDEVARWNEAGQILARHGVTSNTLAARAATRLPSSPSDAEDDLAAVPTLGWPVARPRIGVPDKGRTALTALRGASMTAHRRGHPYAGTTHLLGALVADPAGPAARLLGVLGVDVDAVRADVATRLEDTGRLHSG